MDTMTPSPQTVQETATMSFQEAVLHLIAGKRVHKLEWIDKANYGVIEDHILMLHKTDGKSYQWILNDGDLTGNDYIILQELN